MRYFLCFIFFVVSSCNLFSQEYPFEYYVKNHTAILQRGNEREIKQAISDISLIKSQCKGGCNNAMPYFLLGVFKCKLNDESCNNEFDFCLNKYPLKLETVKYISDLKKECRYSSNYIPPFNPLHYQKSPGTKGWIKSNWEATSVFDRNRYELFDTTKHFNEIDSYKRIFYKSEIEIAKKFYFDYVSKSPLKKELTLCSQSQNILLYHSKSIKGQKLLDDLEKNLIFYEKNFGLQRPQKLITIFLIPISKLNENDRKDYKWKFRPTLKFPDAKIRKKTPQKQQSPQDFELKMGHREKVPLYLYQKDFLLFTYNKDGVMLDEGVVGYNNKVDYTINCFEKNGIGALNHELLHLVISHNFPGCPIWLEEGLAALYEAAIFDSESLTLSPLDNFRVIQLKEIHEIKVIDSIKHGTIISIFEVPRNHLDSLFNSDWNTNTLYKTAVARYFCYYLNQKNVLKPFFNEIMSISTEKSAPDIEKISLLLLKLTNKGSIYEVESDFEQFIMQKKELTMKNGKLKLEYQAGLLNYKDF